jgi:cell shape-determining protein MreD
MKTYLSTPRLIAGLLSIAGIFWAARFLCFFVSPIAALVVFPGYLVWGLWVWRVLSSEPKPVFVITWVFSMVWHLAIVLTAPLIYGLMHDTPFIRIYAVSALLLSLVGFLAEVRQKPKANKPAHTTAGNAPV